ncbi:MAG: hypothetical protein AMS27_17825 [Bacteroides sp. SM23_62_1]|nr:MAG: hypothetical protein AMS27_17825 [Bacteroides sp. SM23_62_1]
MRLELYGSKDLNFVELNITGTEDQYVKCDPESQYIDSIVFNLFADCFEKANNLYEYYEPTKFNARYIVPLRNRLLTNLAILENIKSLPEFQDHIGLKVHCKDFLLALIRKDKNWMNHWTTFHEELIKINKDLLDLVDFCIDEDRLLWVVGY